MKDAMRSGLMSSDRWPVCPKDGTLVTEVQDGAHTWMECPKCGWRSDHGDLLDEAIYKQTGRHPADG